MPVLPSGAVFQRIKGRRQLFTGPRSALHPNYPECGPCEGKGWVLDCWGRDEKTNRPTDARVADCRTCHGSGVAPANEAARGLLRFQ